MRYLITICVLVLTSCQIRFVPLNYYTSAPIITPPVYTYVAPRTYWWNPRPTYLGNVYYAPRNHYHTPQHHTPQHHNPRPKTNLPLHTGPIGGRRK